jgi:hypothetical protein
MIYLRTFALTIIILSVVLLNWNCGENNVIIPGSNTNLQTDGPCGGINDEYMLFKVEEYVKITPYEDGPSYYEYRTLMDITCCDCFQSLGWGIKKKNK